MDYVAVTVQDVSHKTQKDFLLPIDQPQYLILGLMAKSFGYHKPDNYRYRLAKAKSKAKFLPLQMNLRELGVCNGDYLCLCIEKMIGNAYLIYMHKFIYHLEKMSSVIGCRYGKDNVDIDMTGLPNYEFISTRHAKIVKDGSKFFVIDLESTNGTRLNRTELNPHQKYELNENDEILLSASEKTGIKLVFKTSLEGFKYYPEIWD